MPSNHPTFLRRRGDCWGIVVNKSSQQNGVTDELPLT